MKLREHEGLALFERYGIAVPQQQLLESSKDEVTLTLPVVLKAQVLAWDRKRAGGIVFAADRREVEVANKKLFGADINGEVARSVLAQEKLDIASEYYVSISYDTDTRGPVLALSTRGGTGTDTADLFPIDMVEGLPLFLARQHVARTRFASEDINSVASVITKLWKLFTTEYARVAEINPLAKTKDGALIAADAKVTIDDDKERPESGRIIEMGGDIAVIASGGGASLLNVDALLRAGGRPANYTEYSGNPPAEVVTDLTEKILSQDGLKGCWVVGGTANFTDIYETMSGFVEGLRRTKPTPTYPIVIRRDGPRQKEAFVMLEEFKKKEGFDLHLYDSHTPMVETARVIVDLAYKDKDSHDTHL